MFKHQHEHEHEHVGERASPPFECKEMKQNHINTLHGVKAAAPGPFEGLPLPASK